MKSVGNYKCSVCHRLVPCRKVMSSRTGAILLFPLLHSKATGQTCSGHHKAIQSANRPVDDLGIENEAPEDREMASNSCTDAQPARFSPKDGSSPGPEVEWLIEALRRYGLKPTVTLIDYPDDDGKSGRCQVAFSDHRRVRFSISGKTVIGCMDRGLVLAQMAALADPRQRP